MTFEVETSSLGRTIEDMAAELDKIGGVGKELFNAVAALDGMWEGAAHDTFVAQYQADQEVLSQMTRTIADIIDGLRDARKTYQECEQSVKTKIDKIVI